MAELLQPLPLTFVPVYKSYVWGGATLPQRLGRTNFPQLERYAESWELADHPDGMSVAADGPCAGETLRGLMTRFGPALTGTPAAEFPLLIKILDAADKLSVQVHPDDESARRHGGQAKTECWYILDAAPGASVWAGLQPGVTPESFRRALETGTVAELLQKVPVARGDLLFIPGGLVHAVGAGCLILEVQQNSNTTYRVFDWNRTGTDGKPRELHVEEALRVIRWREPGAALTAPGGNAGTGNNRLRDRLACTYFRLEELTLREPLPVRHDGASFHALFVIRGDVRIRGAGFERIAPAGGTTLLPAILKAYELAPVGAESVVMRVSVPPVAAG
ncbi:MAG: type I phosphomannose isomerase catalytic subunit [Kiritimatiellia bacterium]